MSIPIPRSGWRYGHDALSSPVTSQDGAGDHVVEAVVRPKSHHFNRAYVKDAINVTVKDMISVARSLSTELVFGVWQMWFMLFVVVMLIWSFSWLYMASAWDPLAYTKNLPVAVLNCDAGFSGGAPGFLASRPPIANTMLHASIWNQSSEAARRLNWQNFTCDGASNAGTGSGCGSNEAACYQQLVAAVEAGEYWAALFVPGELSSLLTTQVKSYGGVREQLAFRYIWDQGRGYTTHNWVWRIVSSVVDGVSRGFGNVVAAEGGASSLFAPTFFVTPIHLQDVNLHPVTFFGQAFATYVMCMLQWIGAAAIASTSFLYRMPLEVEANRTGSTIPVKEALKIVGLKALVGSGVYMLVLNILLVVVLAVMGQGHTQWVGYNAAYAVVFGWYMSWSFVALNAMLVHIFGIERFSGVTALLIVLQLASCEAWFTIDLSPAFFQIGKALPFYWGVRGYRAIFFGSQATMSSMALNWGVLTAYNVLCGIGSVVFTAFRFRWRAMRAQSNQRRSLRRGGSSTGGFEGPAAAPPGMLAGESSSGHEIAVMAAGMGVIGPLAMGGGV